MYKRIIGLFLTLVILTSTFTAVELVAHAWDWDAGTSNVTADEFSRNQSEASRQINAMYDGFGQSHYGSYIYPDFFAGITFDADGRLVISIEKTNLEQARDHSSIGPLLEAGVQYRLVEFSQAELIAVLYTIWPAVRERFVPRSERSRRGDWCRYANYIADNMTWGWPCSVQNRVIVGLYNYDEAMIAGFRRYVYDSPMILFEQGNWLYLNGQGSILPTVAIATALLAVIIGIFVTIKRRRHKNSTHSCQTCYLTL